MSQTFGGAWALQGLLDPINGAILANVLGRIERELFEADWAEAKERVGERVCAGDLARTPAQRRADALVEMARRAAAMPAGARLPEPLFSVLVGYETFAGRTCELANGTVVSPGSLLPWLERAWVERVVFDGPKRIKDIGVRRASSPAPPGGRCSYETGSASTPTATGWPRTVRSTTCGPGRRVGSPWRTTAGWRVGSTTGSGSDRGRRHNASAP